MYACSHVFSVCEHVQECMNMCTGVYVGTCSCSRELMTLECKVVLLVRCFLFRHRNEILLTWYSM